MDITKCTRLLALAERCLQEPASRRLDGEIYCAVHGKSDLNTLGNEHLMNAAFGGDVLLGNNEGTDLDWVSTPAFTTELTVAKSLLPNQVLTITKDPRQVCAFALMAEVAASREPYLRTIGGEVVHFR
jgi:hypothetical protein